MRGHGRTTPWHVRCCELLRSRLHGTFTSQSNGADLQARTHRRCMSQTHGQSSSFQLLTRSRLLSGLTFTLGRMRSQTDHVGQSQAVRQGPEPLRARSAPFNLQSPSSLTTLSRHMIQLQRRSTIRLPDLLQALVAESPRMECKQGRERSRQPTCPRHQRAPPTVGPPRARLIWMSDHRVQNLRVGPQAPAPCALSSRDPDHIYPFRGKISPQRPLEDHPRISSFSIPSIPSWFGRCCRSVMQMMRAPPSAQGLQVIKDPLDGQKCAV